MRMTKAQRETRKAREAQYWASVDRRVAEQKLVECPTCGGKGVQVLETTTWSVTGKTTESTTITCVVCKGKKQITAKEKQGLIDEAALWCSCGNPSKDVEFYDDGECTDCDKHHYHCSDCRKIVQVG